MDHIGIDVHKAHRLPDPQRHVRGRLLARDALVRTRTPMSGFSACAPSPASAP